MKATGRSTSRKRPRQARWLFPHLGRHPGVAGRGTPFCRRVARRLMNLIREVSSPQRILGKLSASPPRPARQWRPEIRVAGSPNGFRATLRTGQATPRSAEDAGLRLRGQGSQGGQSREDASRSGSLGCLYGRQAAEASAPTKLVSARRALLEQSPICRQRPSARVASKTKRPRPHASPDEPHHQKCPDCQGRPGRVPRDVRVRLTGEHQGAWHGCSVDPESNRTGTSGKVGSITLPGRPSVV